MSEEIINKDKVIDNGNGDIPKDLVMTITFNIEKGFSVTFPFLTDKVVTYGFITSGEKCIDEFYRQAEQKLIKTPNAGFRQFLKFKK
jgi:hypothetical protein